MKRIILLLLVILLSQWAYTKSFNQKIEQDLDAGRLRLIEAVYLQGLRILNPAQLPKEYRTLIKQPTKSGFATIVLIRHYWDKFNSSQKDVLAPLYYRPVREHSLISPSKKFKIHYSIDGYNGISAEDNDMNGVPDYAEKTACIMDSVYTIEVEQMGFQRPPLDDLSETEWDIYIGNHPDVYGWTNPEILKSTNPDIWTSYMEVDNDYMHTKTKGLNGLRVTLAHEFFHMIQLGYNARNEDFNGRFDDQFYMEASSTWMEDYVFDHINDYYYYLDDFFQYTNYRFDRFDNWHEYGLCLWFHFLEDRFSPYVQKGAMVRRIWEKIVDYPALKATDLVLQEFGRSFGEEMAIFYGWNYRTGTRADTINFYPEGYAYPEIFLEGIYPFTLDTVIVDEVQPTAARYYQFITTDGTQLTFIPSYLDWEAGQTADSFSIALVRGNYGPNYINLDNNIQTRMIVNDVNQWRCFTFIEKEGQPTQWLIFDATKAPVNSIISDGDQNIELPVSYPNPFLTNQHSKVEIPFVLQEPGLIRVTVFNALGRLLYQYQKYVSYSGLQRIDWNGRDNRGQPVPSGVYLYVVSSAEQIIRKEKFAVVR